MSQSGSISEAARFPSQSKGAIVWGAGLQRPSATEEIGWQAAAGAGIKRACRLEKRALAPAD